MTMAGAGVAKLIEECGELVQVLGKRLAMWDKDDHWDGTNLRDRMAEEMGDVMGAINFVADRFGILHRVHARADEKLALFDNWQAQLDNNDHGVDATNMPPALTEALIHWRQHGYHQGELMEFDDQAASRLKGAIDGWLRAAPASGLQSAEDPAPVAAPPR